MSSTPLPPEPDKDSTPEEIEADIAAARERLAEDVEALAAKADVRGQAKARIDATRRNVGETAQRVQHQAQQQAQRVQQRAQRVQHQATDRVQSLPRPARIVLPAGFAAIVAALFIIVATRRSRSSEPSVDRTGGQQDPAHRRGRRERLSSRTRPSSVR